MLNSLFKLFVSLLLKGLRVLQSVEHFFLQLFHLLNVLIDMFDLFLLRVKLIHVVDLRLLDSLLLKPIQTPGDSSFFHLNQIMLSPIDLSHVILEGLLHCLVLMSLHSGFLILHTSLLLNLFQSLLLSPFSFSLDLQLLLPLFLEPSLLLFLHSKSLLESLLISLLQLHNLFCSFPRILNLLQQLILLCLKHGDSI